MIYRNMYLGSTITSREGYMKETDIPFGPLVNSLRVGGGYDKLKVSNTERDIKKVMDTLLRDFSTHKPSGIWPVLSLLKVSSWSIAKPNIISIAGGNGVDNGYDAVWDRRSQLQRLLRWKRLSSAAKTIPDCALHIAHRDPSLVYARSSRCYASIVYGTRRCEWVKLLQNASGGHFFNRFYHKINFLESELEYAQLVYQHYL